jgi:hypothetical protein
MKLFQKSHDGGKDSGVTGYWLIEWKWLFSIVLLRFSKGSREAFHSHAFNAWTLWLKGSVVEEYLTSEKYSWSPFKWKYTPRTCFHKIIANETSWAISFRGPWADTWEEFKDGKKYTLTSGRKLYTTQTTNVQDLFNKLINLGYYASIPTYNSSRFMCIAAVYAKAEKAITPEEYAELVTAIKNYLQRGAAEYSLDRLLQINGLPCNFNACLQVYKNWSKRPTLRDNSTNG